ncbi:DUF4387 domain-containing protein [Humitalea sp. 24SJ18S-53]|uniref:DUF4387 domain-containing protein n=1 Tax=Humitalea sp. 24SJ18S-53 TaxID=3422307 RepID=UPI003D66C267
MATLGSYAQTLRSKNAGALMLTIDVIMTSEAAYQRVMQSPALTAARIAGLYGVAAKDVQIIPYPQVHAIKVTLPRAIASGDIGDSDVYGAQQHVPLMLLDLDSD